jgi:hypothetical protein
MLQSIAVGEYKSPEERQAEADKVLEEEAAAKVIDEIAQSEEKAPEAETGAAESEADSSSKTE